MTDHPASWRMPTRAQMEKIAVAVDGKATPMPGLAPNEDLPHEYWRALLEDARADGISTGRGPSGRLLRLSQIHKHLLQVSCSRCARTVEIQKADAIRLYGQDAIWKDVRQRLLDSTCSQRTGRHEEDGCWPSYDMP